MRARVAVILIACFSLLASIAGAQMSGVTATSLATGTSDSALIAATPSTDPQLYFCGFSAMETVGSAASTVKVYNGTSTSGVLMFSFSLVANESRSEGPWAPNQCILSAGGIFIDRGGSGSTLISVYSRTGLGF